jgi:hypothetical protein
MEQKRNIIYFLKKRFVVQKKMTRYKVQTTLRHAAST